MQNTNYIRGICRIVVVSTATIGLLFAKPNVAPLLAQDTAADKAASKPAGNSPADPLTNSQGKTTDKQVTDPNSWPRVVLSGQYVPNDFVGTAVPFAGNSVTLDVHINADVRGASLRDALKRLFKDQKASYEVDKDVPDQLKLTLKSTNITLSTALNAIIESAGIGCTVTAGRAAAPVQGGDVVTPNLPAPPHYHFVKTAGQPIGMGWWLPYTNTNARNYYWNITNGYTGSNVDRFYYQTPESRATYGTPNSSKYNNSTTLKPDTNQNSTDSLNQKQPQDKQSNPTNLVFPDANAAKRIDDAVALVMAEKPVLYDIFSAEQRSTFTCPHCKQQLTVLRKYTAPKCTTCGRPFQKDWKYCPVDGAKRPGDPTEWKFCPHCGKAVS